MARKGDALSRVISGTWRMRRLTPLVPAGQSPKTKGNDDNIARITASFQSIPAVTVSGAD
jgi:hypothetical protein